MKEFQWQNPPPLPEAELLYERVEREISEVVRWYGRIPFSYDVICLTFMGRWPLLEQASAEVIQTMEEKFGVKLALPKKIFRNGRVSDLTMAVLLAKKATSEGPPAPAAG